MRRLPHSFILPLGIVGGILAVSTASVFIRFAQQDAPSLVIAAARLSLASLILSPVALTRFRAELATLTRREWLLGALSGLFLALHFATWISSLEYTSVASSVVLVTTTPLWVALFAPIFLREPITRAILTGMLLALAGGVIIGLSEVCSWETGLMCNLAGQSSTSGQVFWGNFLALSGAWMAAGYIIIGRSVRAKMSLVPYIFVVYGMAAIVLIMLMFGTGQSPLGYAPQTYGWMLALAIVPQLLGHSTFNWALGYLPASLVSITLLGEPIGSIILAYFLLNESPTLLELLGGTLILVGIYVASQRTDKRVTAEEASIAQ